MSSQSNTVTMNAESEQIGKVRTIQPSIFQIVQLSNAWLRGGRRYDGESPIFSPRGNEELKFYLKTTTSPLALSLCLLPCKTFVTQLEFEVTVVDCKFRSPPKRVFHSNSITEYKVNKIGLENEGSLWEKQRKLNFDDLVETMKCMIKLTTVSPDEEAILIKESESLLRGNLRQLFETRECFDVAFNICGQEVPAHKGILSLHSSVFSAMFNHDMMENHKHRVNINDMDSEVFIEMLRFIYLNDVTTANLENMADKLLAAAEKYQLDRLKAVCENILNEKITIANAADTLILADLYRADKLKDRVIGFIHEDLEAVMETQGFKSMNITHPLLMADILRYWTN